jgi:hypothetical protein
VATFTAIGSIIGSEWASDEALAAKLRELEEAGALAPELDRGDHLVDVRFGVEAADEAEAQDTAHRVLTKAATTFGWMITAIVEPGAGTPGEE